jgi:hypothetical protein
LLIKISDIEWGMMVHAYNPMNQAETVGQPGLNSENLSQNKNKELVIP